MIDAVLNSLRPRQNGRHFADDIFNRISLNENVWTPIKISLKLVPMGPIDNIPALVQIVAWCRPGDKPLSEPRMVSLATHICVTRPQWVKSLFYIALDEVSGLAPTWHRTLVHIKTALYMILYYTWCVIWYRSCYLKFLRCIFFLFWSNWGQV